MTPLATLRRSLEQEAEFCTASMREMAQPGLTPEENRDWFIRGFIAAGSLLTEQGAFAVLTAPLGVRLVVPLVAAMRVIDEIGTPDAAKLNLA